MISGIVLKNRAAKQRTESSMLELPHAQADHPSHSPSHPSKERPAIQRRVDALQFSELSSNYRVIRVNAVLTLRLRAGAATFHCATRTSV
jgi:hypothetical protein